MKTLYILNLEFNFIKTKVKNTLKLSFNRRKDRIDFVNEFIRLNELEYVMQINKANTIRTKLYFNDSFEVSITKNWTIK